MLGMLESVDHFLGPLIMSYDRTVLFKAWTKCSKAEWKENVIFPSVLVQVVYKELRFIWLLILMTGKCKGVGLTVVQLLVLC